MIGQARYKVKSNNEVKIELLINSDNIKMKKMKAHYSYHRTQIFNVFYFRERSINKTR